MLTEVQYRTTLQHRKCCHLNHFHSFRVWCTSSLVDNLNTHIHSLVSVLNGGVHSMYCKKHICNLFLPHTLHCLASREGAFLLPIWTVYFFYCWIHAQTYSAAFLLAWYDQKANPSAGKDCYPWNFSIMLGVASIYVRVVTSPLLTSSLFTIKVLIWWEWGDYLTNFHL